MTKLSFLPSLQKTRHPAAGGNTTYRLTVIVHGEQRPYYQDYLLLDYNFGSIFVIQSFENLHL